MRDILKGVITQRQVYMTATSHQPLSDEEICELDDFLLSRDEGEDSLTVDEAHGFITSLIVSCSTVEESEWMEAIWGLPAFNDDNEQQHMIQLLRRMRTEIHDMLGEGKRFDPLIAEFEEDSESFVSYEGWCYGFMLAVSLAHTQWDKLPKNEQELLGPIARIALLGEEEGEELDDEELEILTELIPGSVIGLYQYWHRH